MKNICLAVRLGVGIGVGIGLGLAPAAWADNVAHCEVLLVNVIEDAETNGQAQLASYRPAVEFIASVYDDAPEHLTEIDGHAIRALLCRRNDVIPAETDYPMIATGVPFIASQDFDRADTDSLTVYWKDGELQHIYKGYPLSDESQKILDARLADFNARGLNDMARASAKEGETETVAEAAIELEAEVEIEAETEIKAATADPEIETAIETAIETEIEITE